MTHEGLNEYFQQLLGGDKAQLLPEDLRTKCIEDARTMSAIGVQSPDDQRVFWVVFHGTPGILQELLGDKPNMEDVARVAASVFAKRKERKLHNLVGLFDAVARGAHECRLPVSQRVLSRIKAAYPQGPGSRQPRPPYDMNRWMQATQDIYVGMREQNIDFSTSLRNVTKEWEPVEMVDFKQWLKMYQQGVPDKYPKLATAQPYYENGDPGFFIPNPIAPAALKSRIPSPIGPKHEETDADRAAKKEKEVSDRDNIEMQRAKIISRLNAAEKLLASMEGQTFAGELQELMLKLLQDLKRKVQTANKINVKSSLFEDYIYREANRLRASGYEKQAGFFEKIAQPMDPMMDPMMGGAPVGAEPTVDPSAGEDPKEGTRKAIEELSEFMETGTINRDDEREERDAAKKTEQQPPAAPAAPAAPPQEMPVAASLTDDGDIIVEAQAIPADVPPAPPAPPPAPPVEAPPAPPAEAPVAAEEEADEPKAEEPSEEEHTDDVIEAALQNISIHDVIRRLEMLVSIYNQREIPRQMSVLDIMMHRLGLASLFPNLGEAMGKALESHQYIGTRLEDILTKLKGSLKSETAVEWTEPQQDDSPETETVRRNLEQERAQEEMRREQRRARELEKAQQAAAPGVGEQAPGELAAPSKVERTQPIPTR